MKYFTRLAVTVVLIYGVIAAAFADNKPVGITPTLMSVEVTHKGKKVKIERNQDNKNTVIPEFAMTSRPCPPFCIQPMTAAPGVETIGELELLSYIQQIEAGDSTILVIDSRTPDWVERGTIPGAKNVSWVQLNPGQGATTASITKTMQDYFDVKLVAGVDEFDIDEAIVNGNADDVFDYSAAKTLVLFCNGMWCGQSPASIKTLLKFGYPAEKIKWYRDGMQAWEMLGFTTAKP